MLSSSQKGSVIRTFCVSILFIVNGRDAMKNIILILLTLIGFILSQDCEEPINVWFKVSNAEKDYGQLLILDMSKGFATTDGLFIYLIVKNKDTGEDLVIQFPIGYWIIDKIDKKIPKQEKKKEEFDLDEYLKKNKGKGKIINLNITEVGE